MASSGLDSAHRPLGQVFKNTLLFGNTLLSYTYLFFTSFLGELPFKIHTYLQAGHMEAVQETAETREGRPN
jgi:hypothetical protein